jgi:deaminated glutathione amidase
MIIDPWGQILGELPDGPGVITAEIDLDYLAKVRAELPALKHRRLV